MSKFIPFVLKKPVTLFPIQKTFMASKEPIKNDFPYILGPHIITWLGRQGPDKVYLYDTPSVYGEKINWTDTLYNRDEFYDSTG